MDNLVDMIVSDESASDISDKIKEILFTKASERVDSLRPQVASTLFNHETETEE